MTNMKVTHMIISENLPVYLGSQGPDSWKRTLLNILEEENGPWKALTNLNANAGGISFQTYKHITDLKKARALVVYLDDLENLSPITTFEIGVASQKNIPIIGQVKRTAAVENVSFLGVHPLIKSCIFYYGFDENEIFNILENITEVADPNKDMDLSFLRDMEDQFIFPEDEDA